jgi:hypothetical protein
MSLRKDALDVSIFTVGGVSFLGDTKTWDFAARITDDDCRVASDRYHSSQPVKKALEFTIERIPHVTGICQSNLHVSVYSVGGTSFLGELESGTININSDVEDGSGIADIWEFPNVLGTDFELQTNHFITSNADLFQAAIANNISEIQVTVIITLGPVSVTLPMTMTAANHRIEAGQIQMQNVTFKSQGEPDAASGDAITLEILTGDAFVAWAIDTDAGAYSGNAIITQTTINFNNAQLQTMEHTLANQGAPSFTPA